MRYKNMSIGPEWLVGKLGIQHRFSGRVSSVDERVRQLRKQIAASSPYLGEELPGVYVLMGAEPNSVYFEIFDDSPFYNTDILFNEPFANMKPTKELVRLFKQELYHKLGWEAE